MYQVTKQLSARSDSFNQLRLATRDNDEPVLLKHTIPQGWPSTIKEVYNALQPYWAFHKEHTLEDGLVLTDTRIVIPTKKCDAVLKLIHEGHLGLSKCKLHVKDTVYWPGLNDQLEKLVLNCELYLKYSQSKCKQQPTLSLGQEIPLHAWTKLATDIFHFEGASYLLIVDYTSRFPVVHKLSSMNEQHIATHCKQVFSEYGCPETFMSDNEPCYTVEAFTIMMKEYGVNHITSSPHYPQPNGFAEKYVQIVKNLFDKAKEEGKYMFKCLMIYHNTPLLSNLQSPMQILQNRSTRSNLPMSNVARHQLGLNPEQLRSKFKNEHLPSYDLYLGQHVMFQDSTNKQWFPATITSLCSEPRSYKITTKEGVTYRKTQSHLKPYNPQQKKTEDEHYKLQSSDMQTVKSYCKQCRVANNPIQSYSRPKRDINPPFKLDL